MNLKVQKRLASLVGKCSPKRIKFSLDRLSDIKEAITRSDINSLINQGAITVLPKKGISRGRTRHAMGQKRKGRRRGPGSRKGSPTARLSRKTRWMQKIRLQRKILLKLRETKQLAPTDYRILYRKAKAGLFRSKHHLMVYLDENKLRKK